MRTIRLKETPAGRREHTPTDEYRKECDASLGPGPFIQEGTADGFLATGNDRPDATRNLVMVGGSFVESMFAPATARFASRVERELPAEWRVLNAGRSGMTTLHLLSVMAAKLPPFLVDGGKLVIFIGHSDVSALSRPGSYWDSRHTVTPLIPASETIPVPWEPREASERLTDAVCATATALGIDYGLVAAPFRDGDFNDDRVLRVFYERNRRRYERATNIRRSIRDVTVRIAERHGRPVFDSQQFVEPADFYDVVHLNEDGQERYSDRLTAWLRTWAVDPRDVPASELPDSFDTSPLPR